MTGVRIGSKECPIEELVEVFKSEDLRIIELGEVPVISQFMKLPLEYLDLPPYLKGTRNDRRYKAMQKVLLDWSKLNTNNANLGMALSFIQEDFKWKTMTGFLRTKIQTYANNFSELDENSKMQLLDVQFMFLARQICLKTLKSIISREEFDEIINSIDNSFIVKVLQNNCSVLDEFLPPKDPPNYISRTVEAKRKLSPQIFKHACDDIFVFEPQLPGGLDLSILVRPNPADVSGAQVHSLTVRFILLEEEEHFAIILKKTTSPVHRIKYTENSYFWICTIGSIKVIREFLSGEVEEISEDNVIKYAVSDSDSHPIAICGGPGTGKSVLLASMANKMIQNYSERYVIFLNFPKLIRQQKLLDINNGSGDDTKRLVEIFRSTTKMNCLAATILNGLMRNEKMQFEIFLDRFDEILFEDISLAKQLLKLLLKHSNLRIYMTFGPTLRNELENHLQIISYDIFPFRKDEMEFFLSKMVNSEAYQMIFKSVDLIGENEDLHKETSGNPLLCSMLAKLFSSSTATNINTFGEKSVPKSPIKSLTELYSRYMEMEIQLKQIDQQYLELFKLKRYRDAFHKLFYCNSTAELVVHALEKHINQFTISGAPISDGFEHKTFSEYLVAQFIIENWKESTIVDKQTLCKFTYQTLFSTCKRDENAELSEIYSGLDYDTLEKVLSKIGPGNDSTLRHFIDLGWDRSLEHLQRSVLNGQLTFRHSTICYFLNDITSNNETFESCALDNLNVSRQHTGMISKDFISKMLVSLSLGYKHLFRLTSELFRAATHGKDSYVDQQTCHTVLILAVRQDDIKIFSHFRRLVEANDGRDITSVKFHCDNLKNMTYEHTPLHEAARTGNYEFFEHLFKVYKNKLQTMPGLVQVCLSDSSYNSENVIRNKIKILRMLSSKNIKYDFKNIKDSMLDGIHVTLFTKVCDMIGYTLIEKDVKWFYKFVFCYFTKINQMDVFVNWLISKDLARFLLYSYEPNNFLLIDSLRQNVLGPQSLENIYHAHYFAPESIIPFVMKCKNRLALVKTIVDLIGGVSLDDENDPTIVQWATSMFEYDPMNYVSFDKSDRANMSQRLTDHKKVHVKLHSDEIRRIIKDSKSITESGQILYNSNEILGKGRFSIVYRGTLNARPVAVKKIYYKAEQEEHVAQETKLLLECDGHENIIKCFYVQKFSQTILIALELCKFTLEKWVEMNHLTDVKVQALQIIYQITKGLDFLHCRNVVHLDITPQNILLSPTLTDIKAKIGDFGNSMNLSVSNVHINLEDGSGTVKWMAPEVIKVTSLQKQDLSQKLSTTADIFSLGCVFYYVLSNGAHPFGVNMAQIKSNIQLDKPCFDTSLFKEPLFIHLFYLMTNQKQDDRPTAAALLKHHIFWSEKKMLSFLVAVSNAADQPTVTSETSKIMNIIENYPLLKPYYEPQGSKGWIRFLCRDIQKYVSGIGCKRKPYHGDLFFDLVRAIRNMQAHRFDLPSNVQTAVGAVPNSFMKYWLKRFAIIFEIIWLKFEDMKMDTSSALLEYYSKDYDFNREEISERADKILAKYIRYQCTEMILRRTTI